MPEKTATRPSTIGSTLDNVPKSNQGGITKNETLDAPSVKQGPQPDLYERFNSLRSVLAARRADIHIYRNLFFSTLASAFTVPLGALTVSHPEMFHHNWFYFFPVPGGFIFSSWVFGIISMLLGLYRMLPGRNGRGLTTEYWEEKADGFAVEEKPDQAIECMNKAIKREQELFNHIFGAKNFFFAAFASFGLALALEFALVVTFSPAPIQIFIPQGR